MSGQSQLKNYTDCGVYAITHIETGKIYVGSSKTVIKRKSRHLTLLKKNQHWNHYLQSAYNKYGASAFVFKTIIACPPEDRIFHEQRLIDQYNSADRKFGYNLSKIVDEVTEYSAESRKKMSLAKIGKGQWNIGKPCSEEKRKKISEANKGREGWNKGGSLSKETREKISKSLTGKITSEETKKKLSIVHKGKKFSKETREKISAANVKTHCKHGHVLGDGNVSYSVRGRRCLSCHRESSKKYRQNKKGESL